MFKGKVKKLVRNKSFIRTSLIILAGLTIVFWFCLPELLFNDPTSTVIEDRSGKLLGAKIAEDGQWRFPIQQDVPEKFKICIIQFEDRYFFKHPGINPGSLVRAAIQNIRSGRIVSGGSTLSMQVIRLSRKGKPRTILEKAIEMVLAMRLEIRYSKDEILALYASNAPFGGNVVGLEAATWRYFGQPPEQLSWAESATLAVLPNAPSLIYPGKNHLVLLSKRNKLLKALTESGMMTNTDYELALLEPLPGKPIPLEQAGSHLLSDIYLKHKGEKIRTTVNYSLQKSTTEVVERHQKNLAFNQIHNAAALVVEVESGNVLAWVGNVVAAGKDNGCDVDMIRAPRSTGSILKPILFAAMLDDGLFLPNTLVPDVPTKIGGFNPMNFDKQYAGAVPAQKALYRSLNVPAVKMLLDYGVPRFRNLLTEVGMTTLDQPADHYGLSLILGGAETTMFDLAGVYSSFSRVLNHFYANSGKYDPVDFRKPNYFQTEARTDTDGELEPNGIISAASIWFTYEAMRKVNRPEELSGWNSFSSSNKIAWKTGTSFGFRDAWAVGTNPEYVVVVWVGNADGEGRPGLTGVSCAAPIMFDIFNLLPPTGWFDPPMDEMDEAVVCSLSGYRAGRYCDRVDTVYIPLKGMNTPSCPYHQQIHLDPVSGYRVTEKCFDPGQMIHASWFVLPPLMEWYFRKNNPLYQPLPPFAPGCVETQRNPMEFVYPVGFLKMYIPLNLQGLPEAIIIEIAHRDDNVVIYWHLDEEYLGQTREKHQMEIKPGKGMHTLTIVDHLGNTLIRNIEILDAELVAEIN
ncbi:MAG: penicillin-binding protein 1C [Bacteroidales bacterium]|nr:penicillin-binding protein 1C [Bacteroidales bacterium]